MVFEEKPTAGCHWWGSRTVPSCPGTRRGSGSSLCALGTSWIQHTEQHWAGLGHRPVGHHCLQRRRGHNYKNLRQRGTMTDEIFLTGSLLSSSQEVGPNHGPDPWETHQHSHKVDRLVASLQEEPGEHHQHRDHEAVQQLKHIEELTDENIHLKWWRHISWLQTTFNKHRGFLNQFETN